MTLLRSALYSVWFFAVSFTMVMAGQIVPLLPQRLMKPYARLWSRMVLAGLPICGVRVLVTGRENLPPGGAMLIASMHQSAFDTLLWWRIVPDCRYVVKAELMKIPFFGRLARLSGQIAVDRAGGAATMRGLLRDGGRALAEGSQLVIFPEGTRGDPGAPGDYKPGIAGLYRELELPVYPMATNAGVHWSRKGFTLTPGVIVFEYLEPIPPGLKRGEFMRTLEERIEAATEKLLSADPAYRAPPAPAIAS